MSVTESLERALFALEQGLDEEAYWRLLDAWDAAPSRRLERQLCALTERLGEGVSDLSSPVAPRQVMSVARWMAGLAEFDRSSLFLTDHRFPHARNPALGPALLHLADLALESGSEADAWEVVAALERQCAPSVLDALRRRPSPPERLRELERHLERRIREDEPAELLDRLEVRLARACAAETASPEREALLAAVLASPDDDAPRHVLSDWLQERGDPLGEFIALQLARGAGAAERAEQLEASHGQRWCRPLGLPAAQVRFERGFPGRVTLRTEDRREAEPFFGRAPPPAWNTVRRLDLEPALPDAVPSGFSQWIGGLGWLRELRAPATVLRALAHDDPAPKRLLSIEMATPSWSSLLVLAEASFGRRARELQAASVGRWRATFRHANADAPWLACFELLSVPATLDEVLRTLTDLADRVAVAEVKVAAARLGDRQQESLESRLARFPRWSIGSLDDD